MGLRLRVGNGETIKVFKDPSLPRPSTFKPILINQEHREITVAELTDNEGNWDLNLLNQLFYQHDITIIRKLPINRKVADRWIWHFDKKGLYSI